MIPIHFRRTGQRLQIAVLAAITLFLSTGCSTDQVHSSVQFEAISLAADDLETWGLGFITPSTVTGQEQDVQNLAFVFARVLEKERPDIHVVSLPEALSSVNRAGLADTYKQMYVDYSDTGIFKKDALHQVGKVIGVRYLAQLKLSSFNQNSRSRFSFLGLRLMQTKAANIRLFLQIWDSDSGAIVWEGAEEMNYAWDTSSEKPVTFQLIVEEIARNLVNKLPGAPDNPETHNARTRVRGQARSYINYRTTGCAHCIHALSRKNASSFPPASPGWLTMERIRSNKG